MNYKTEANKLISIRKQTPNVEVVDIKGYEGIYSVTSFGEVYSHISKKCLSLSRNTEGHYRVGLYDREGKRTHKYIHQLVADAFVPNPYNESFVCHIDGNKANNAANNLKWGSQSKCMNHHIHNHPRKPKHLTHNDAKAAIYLHYQCEFTIERLGAIYKVLPGAIWQIIQGRTHKKAYHEMKSYLVNQTSKAV